MSIDEKLLVLFMQQLRLDKQFATVSVDIAALEPRFVAIERNTAIGWTPSKPQEVRLPLAVHTIYS